MSDGIYRGIEWDWDQAKVRLYRDGEFLDSYRIDELAELAIDQRIAYEEKQKRERPKKDSKAESN